MPFNADGSWTSNKTGKTYPGSVTRSELSDDENNELNEDLKSGRPGTAAGAGGDLGSTLTMGPNELGKALGFVPNIMDPDAPGATLDTNGADAQRERQQQLVASLQQQAATGDGAWQQRFKEGVEQTVASASALGQSNPNVDAGAALTNIDNAQAAARQRAVPEEQMLREQQKVSARGQLADVLAPQAQMDLAQSAESARVERERRAINQASLDQSLENRKNTEKGITGMFGMNGGGMSEGGEVPGEAPFGGNDPRNDTEPAMLSAEEIVIPRDIALAPDAPERAARFVAAVKAGYNPQAGDARPRGLAEGGKPGFRQPTDEEAGGSGMIGAQFIGGPFARTAMFNKLRSTVGAGGGGELDTTQYDQTAAQQDDLAALFAGQAAGTGPSVAPALQTKRTNATMEAAQAAQTQGGMPAGDLLQTGSAAGVESAADVGRVAGKEQAAGQDAFGRLLRQRRAQELQLASAQQQAGMQKTAADMGLSLKNQADLRGAVSAAGQGAAAFAGAGQGTDSNDFAERGSPSDLSRDDPEFKAKGGPVREGAYPAMPKPQNRTPHVDVQLGELELETDEQRRARTYEEETGDPMPPKRARRDTERESSFAKALRSVGELAKRATGTVSRMAEGGGVGDAGSLFTPYDPYAIEPRRDTGPVVYVSSTPVPGTQPVPVPSMPPPSSGAGGGGGSDLGMAGAGGAGGASGAPTPADRGSGGATGGPSDNQIPQHEAIQPRAQRPGPLELPAGVVPKGSAAPPPPAPAPLPHEAKKPTGSGVPKVDPLDTAANAAEAAAIETTVAADRERAKAQVDAAAMRANAIEQAQLQRKEVEQRARQATADAMTRYQKAADDMSRINATIDPGRFWASRTTGQKVLGFIGLALGAIGAGPDGVNRAAVMLNQAIDRDLEAQKTEHELRLKKGGAAVDAAKSFYAMAREATGDELAATDLARAAALEAAAARGDQLVAQTGDAQAKAKGLQLTAALRRGAQERRASAEQRSFENYIKKEHLENERIAAEGRVAGGAAAAKEAREATATYNKMASTVAKLKGLINDTNAVTEKFGGRAETMKTLAGDLLLQVKDAEHLGALDKGSIQVAEQIIGDPTATFALDSWKIAKLDALLEQARGRVQATGGAR